MSPDFVLSHYIDRAMSKAVYEKFDDGTYGGRVPPCRGVVAFGKTLVACRDELQSTLEDWILLGLRLGHRVPVIDRVDLNIKAEPKPIETVQAD